MIVVVLAAAGGFWWWKQRATGVTPATSTSERGDRGSGSAVSGASSGASVTDGEGTASLVVTVTSDKGPIADATVRLAPEEGDVLLLRTDKSGVARADKLAVGNWEIAASAPGFEPKGLEARELAKDEVAKVSLVLVAGGATLSGTVTDATGGPIAGARVDAARASSERVGRPSDAVATTTTGADGKYQLSVAIGPSIVGVSSPDYAPQSRQVDVLASGTIADFSLVPGGVIEGIVRDEKTKQPVAGASVDARRDGGGGIAFAEAGRYRALSSADGRFRLAGLRPGAYELRARAEKRVTAEPTIVGIGVAEQVTDVELLVGGGLVVSGIVVDENDKPVPKIEVTANSNGGGGTSDSTDDKGAFTFVGLPPGAYFLNAMNDEYVSDGFSPIELLHADIANVKVRVRAALKLTGHVEPRQLCTIAHELDASAFSNNMPMIVAPKSTDANGNFTLPASPAKATLTARCPSGAFGTKEIDPKAGDPPIVIAVKPGASIAGRVLDGKGQPIAGATVMAAPDGNDRRVTVVNGMITSGVQALSNANGEYEVVGLAPGPYKLSVLERGRPLRARGKPVRVTVSEAEKKTGVDISVDRSDGVIRGVVTGPDGKPLADAWVSAHLDVRAMVDGLAGRDDDAKEGDVSRSTTMINSSDAGEASEIAPALTDASGKFEITGLPHAKYEVIAEANAGALRGRVANVTPDATLTIQARGLQSVGGTVKSVSGPVAIFRVELDGPTTAARTFTDGKFQFDRLDVGSYKLRVTSKDGNHETTVDLKEGQRATLDLVLAANAVVIGTVVDANGAPLAGAGIVLIKDEGNGRTQVSLDGPPPMTAADGTFRVEGRAQPSALVVMTPPSPTVKRPLALEAGKTLDVGVIRVEPRAGSGSAP